MVSLPANWKAGINLGNSLDCFEENGPGTETSWGNPVITREMIRMLAASGFDMLRVPVTWDGHFDILSNCKLERNWLHRVQEIVGWGLDEGMTVVLNTHHEFRWLRPELSLLSDVLPVYRDLWKNIAEAFRDFGPDLVFQGSNEPNLMGGENCAWGSGNRNVRSSINALNHTFVRTVRETGGANADRWICIPGLAARPLPDCMKDMIMPKDDRLIYTIHCYVPDRFVFSRQNSLDTPFFDEKAQEEVASMFDDICRFALPHDCPIMITEFGAVAKRLPDSHEWNTADRVRFVEYFLTKAAEMNIPCFWWDNNYLDRKDEYFGLFDRQSLRCFSLNLWLL